MYINNVWFYIFFMVYHYQIPQLRIGNTINMIWEQDTFDTIKQINTLLANFRLQLQKDLVFVFIILPFPYGEIQWIIWKCPKRLRTMTYQLRRNVQFNFFDWDFWAHRQLVQALVL